jgi:hypothetical protein
LGSTFALNRKPGREKFPPGFFVSFSTSPRRFPSIDTAVDFVPHRRLSDIEIRSSASILNLSVPSSAQICFRRRIIMIEVGKQAPDFELASHLAGTKFGLGQFKGQKNVMLVFYPLDWTPT